MNIEVGSLGFRFVRHYSNNSPHLGHVIVADQIFILHLLHQRNPGIRRNMLFQERTNEMNYIPGYYEAHAEAQTEQEPIYCCIHCCYEVAP